MRSPCRSARSTGPDPSGGGRGPDGSAAGGSGAAALDRRRPGTAPAPGGLPLRSRRPLAGGRRRESARAPGPRLRAVAGGPAAARRHRRPAVAGRLAARRDARRGRARTCEVPSGSRVGIDYSDPEAPALAVRVQEVFGWTGAPRVAGRPLVLRLLSPAGRPVAVTADLASFWRTGTPPSGPTCAAATPAIPGPRTPSRRLPPGGRTRAAADLPQAPPLQSDRLGGGSPPGCSTLDPQRQIGRHGHADPPRRAAHGRADSVGRRAAVSDRTRRAPLSADEIVAVAWELSGGDADAVSLRDLGARLGVHPTAIYRHFPAKHELMCAVADRTLEGSATSRTASPTRSRRSSRSSRRCAAGCSPRPAAARVLAPRPDPARRTRSHSPSVSSACSGRSVCPTRTSPAATTRSSSSRSGRPSSTSRSTRSAAPPGAATYDRWRADYLALDADRFPALVALAPDALPRCRARTSSSLWTAPGGPRPPRLLAAGGRQWYGR